MPDGSLLVGFVVASLVVLLLPGPGVVYVVTRSLHQGQWAGLVSVLGLSAGALVHVVAATAGLSAILLTSATAFNIVKILGAIYLVYLGVMAFVDGHAAGALNPPRTSSAYRLFRDGVVVSVLNPKIAIFFLAFLPQFVDPSGPVQLQVFLLGILYVSLALLTDGAYAIFAGRLRGWFGGRVLRGPYPRYASGVVFMGLGVSTAIADR